MKQPFLILIFFVLIALPINAQQAQLSQRWVCLKVDWCLDQEAFAKGKVVPNPICAQKIPNGHRVRLTAKSDAKPLPNTDTYILECLATTSGQVCTTGDSNKDMTIYGKDNTASLKTSDDYQFEGIFTSDGVTVTQNPVRSRANGDIGPVEWQSYSKGNARKFFGLNFFNPNMAATALGQGGEQQGTFSFETQSNLKNCVSINWDPYGRVFDSKTLEPIPGASVTLFKQRDTGVFSELVPADIIGGAIENPYLTKGSGTYSFVIPDGVYKLSVTHPNYTFPNNDTVLNNNYIKAYSDLYPNATGVEIVQKGTIQHRDIPLDATNAGNSYPVKLIEFFYNLDKSSNTLLLEGIASHPLTTIRLYSLKTSGILQTPIRYKLLKTIAADRYGRFKIAIDQSAFGPTEIFGDMELEKVDLTKNTVSKSPLRELFSFIFGRNVNAQQVSLNVIRFNPILSMIKGYAYDLNKTVLPNATTDVYLAYSNKPYYETKTDANGYFDIPSANLPDSPYSLHYLTATGTTQIINTSRFIAQNGSYLEKNGINLNINKGKKLLTKELTTKNEEINLSPTAVPTKVRSVQNSAALLLIGAILLLLIAGTGILLGWYLIKKGH